MNILNFSKVRLSVILIVTNSSEIGFTSFFFLSIRLTVEMWVYILEYCPLHHLSPAAACGLFIHMDGRGTFLNPALVITKDGKKILHFGSYESYKQLWQFACIMLVLKNLFR